MPVAARREFSLFSSSLAGWVESTRAAKAAAQRVRARVKTLFESYKIYTLLERAGSCSRSARFTRFFTVQHSKTLIPSELRLCLWCEGRFCKNGQKNELRYGTKRCLSYQSKRLCRSRRQTFIRGRSLLIELNG